MATAERERSRSGRTAPVPAGVAAPVEAAAARWCGVPSTDPVRLAPPAGIPHGASTPAAGTEALPAIAPAEPIPTYQEPPDVERLAPDRDVEPALPDEARDRAADAADAGTPPVDAAPDAILHVRFAGGAGTDRVVGAMEAFKGLLVERPGSTRVVLHVPAQTGATSLPMELRRGVAYDSELLAEVRRRLGDGIVELTLGGG